MIKNIVFDMGRVLIEWEPEVIVAREGLGEDDSRLLLREVFACGEWAAMDHGWMSSEEGWRRICRRLPERLHENARRCVFDWWKGPLVPIPGMAELVREVKALGYGVYLLSNATSYLSEYFHRIPGSECFDGRIVSADVKLLKPRPEIYRELYRQYGLDPAECFFIDDSLLNVDGAWLTGMNAVVFFGDMARLRRELAEAGVPVKP
ncbi:MAG: HAD family phosphatase [Oscillospiraceae bacterium]|nr:HAD family phosphatase [Oscillospiraceae bacterium]